MSSSRSAGTFRICLAASGGGHVRQLLDLREVWSQHDYFFVTEDTALGETLAREHRTHFLPHFAWGQAKHGKPFRMLGLAFVSFFRSVSMLWRAAHVVWVESFARFDTPSLFGRLAGPLAHDLIIQSAKLASRYPRAKVFDPFRYLDGAP